MTWTDLIKIALAVGVFSVGVELYAADHAQTSSQTLTQTQTPAQVLPASR